MIKKFISIVSGLSLQPTDIKAIAGWFLFGTCVAVIPCLPDCIEKALDLPSQMIKNGYGCRVRKGDLEIRFGKETLQLENNDGNERQ